MIPPALKVITKYNPLLIKKQLVDMGRRAHVQLADDLIGDTFIFASSNAGHFHHGFGRDTAFNAWFLNIAYGGEKKLFLWERTKTAILNYWTFQLPNGKIPHELKPFDPEDPLGKKGFYQHYGEYYMNADSVDATPLMLLVTPIYVSRGSEDFYDLLPHVYLALSWIEENMDRHAGWLVYESNYNGLISQGWMDSAHGGPVDEEGRLLPGCIALVEAQAFAWKALMVWADLLEPIDKEKSDDLRERARSLAYRFNRVFLMEDNKGKYFSHAIILDKKTKSLERRLDVISMNPGFCLWASHNGQSIIDNKYIPMVINRLTSAQMFDPMAGIFTFAKGYALKNGDGYHNGERIIWPFASISVGYGMLSLGEKYIRRGVAVLRASVMPVLEEQSFIEQAKYAKGKFIRYGNGTSYVSCKDQTWTVTAYVAVLKTLGLFEKVLEEKKEEKKKPTLEKYIPYVWGAIPKFFSLPTLVKNQIMKQSKLLS